MTVEIFSVVFYGLFELIEIPQLIKKIPAIFTEHGYSLLCPQKHSNGAYFQ
jgi:hypothetical protein